MEKKEKLLPQLLAYAGKRKVLTYLSMVIAGISQLLALAPFLYIWAILRDVIAGDYSRIAQYGWMAVAFAIASMVVYFGGLMCSHVAAFRFAANMRKTLMQHIMTLPIGFLDALGSGKVRKWVQESTQSTETYLAHVDVFAEKLPDGWNSLIGENGNELSGGERQRISIARAFLKDALIILLGIFIWGYAFFHSRIDDGIKNNHLVTDRIYAWCRNPLYTGWMFICIGVSLFSGNLWVLVLPFIFSALMTIMMKRTEEKWLRNLYGAEYDAYCRHVNRVWPWFPTK